MKRKIFSLAIALAMLVAAFSALPVSAAAEADWIWYPATDGYVTDAGLCTAEDSADGQYTTFTSNEGKPEGYYYPGESSGNLNGSDMGAIPTTLTVALVKYRTTSPESIIGEFVWHNGAAHGQKEFQYVHDGEWHYAIVSFADVTGDGVWNRESDMNWFRYDFVNVTEGKSYSVDCAFVAMFASEADAQSFADADAQGNIADPSATTKPSDPTTKPADPTKAPDKKPDNSKTGDMGLIFVVAAAGLVLSVVAKKKLWN